MAKIVWKPATGRTWKEKLEATHPNHGKIFPTPPRFHKSVGEGTMLIPRPKDVEAVMRTPKKGKVITVSQVRGRLACDAGADSACPLTTGIFMRIVAEAAEEDRRDGKRRITAYWRTIKDDGTLMDRFPGGVEAQAAQLRLEGLQVRPRKGRKSLRIADFERRCVRS